MLDNRNINLCDSFFSFVSKFINSLIKRSFFSLTESKNILETLLMVSTSLSLIARIVFISNSNDKKRDLSSLNIIALSTPASKYEYLAMFLIELIRLIIASCFAKFSFFSDNDNASCL